MITLNNLKPAEGSTKTRKRIGRGQGSGWGTQAGKGHKGQKARKGGTIRLGFEGGQTPTYRRLPKRGFSNYPFSVLVQHVNFCSINKKYTNGEIVNSDSLISKGLIKSIPYSSSIKILAKGELTVKVSFSNEFKFSSAAKELIAKSGSNIN
ncbi:MAG: 50S ribosomal protein L15 [Bacteriovoracaceae bacterium]|nr:50S ribosomal protein L15 [Bacteriovoracaceae bacterium]